MKQQLKAGLKAIGLYEPASRAWIAAEPRLKRLSRGVTRRNERLVAQYLDRYQVRKLHIGCGDNELRGWLNTELCPRGSQIFLDATRRFPFPDNTFNYVYSEHMIEHISLRDAESMLAECFRVLAPGGVVRMVTPDLDFLTALLRPEPDARLRAYIDYSVGAHRIYAPNADGISVFNNFVRAWGHQYIHSADSLGTLLERAGFTQIERASLNESAHDALSGLAKTDRMPPGFVEMESFVLEGTKPAPLG
jgi:predicted SAM-dependent methyltransferase